MFINNNVSFGMVFFCKCVSEFGKVWAFARAEFGMGGTGICPSPYSVSVSNTRRPIKYNIKATIMTNLGDPHKKNT